MRLKILDPYFDEKHELVLFLVMLLFALIIFYFFSFFLSSIYLIALISLFQLPIAYKILKYEELKDVSLKLLKPWKLHYKAIGIYFIFFLSTTVASLILTFTSRSDVIFKAQNDVILAINTGMTGFFYNFDVANYFTTILSNNIRVLIFALVLSLLFGYGSLFIINWNASVFGYAIGCVIKDNLNYLITSNNYFLVILRGVLKYLIHGIPEITAYVIAAFAGGIVFAGLINHHTKSKVFRKVLYDAIDLILISFIILVIAALIETFISPLI